MTELSSVKCCWNAHGQRLMTLHKQFLSLDWRKTRYCWVCDGIGRKLSIMGCCKVAKSSIRSCTLHNLTVWTKQSKMSVQNRPTERESCSIMTMHGHTSLITQNKLTELGWEVLMHPPYSPDFASLDYHLFRALQNSLDGKKLADRDGAETHLGKFFNNKPQKFYTNGIMKLTEKWQKVIDNNGQYILD